MTDQPIPSLPMVNAWAEMQRQVWEGWLALAQPAGQMPSGTAANWLTAWADMQRRMFEGWMAMAQPEGQATPASLTNWMNAWADTQRRVGEAWIAASQPQARAGAVQGSGTAWPSGFDLWWKPFLQFADPATANASLSIADQWMSFMTMGRQMVASLHQATAQGAAGQDWTSAWAGLYGSPAKGGRSPVDPMGNAMARGMMTLTGLPMDMWSRVMSSLSSVPGDPSGVSKMDSLRELSEAGKKSVEQFLAMPPLGYAREYQEQGQMASRHVLEFQQALMALAQINVRIGQHTLRLVQQRLSARQAKNEPLRSLREAYDLYVDCAEEAYGEAVSADEFGVVSAQLTNAAMALKRYSQTMSDNMARAANLPTRSELDTTHRHVHQLKRQLNRITRDLEGRHAQPGPSQGPSTAELAAEIAELRAELRRTRDAAGAVSKPAAPAKRTAAAKSEPTDSTTAEG